MRIVFQSFGIQHHHNNIACNICKSVTTSISNSLQAEAEGKSKGKLIFTLDGGILRVT